MPQVIREKLKHFEARIWPKELPEQTGLQDAIHAPHLAERDRYILAMADSSDRSLQRLANRMATCADSVHLYVEPELGQVKEYVHRCGARLCPLCARKRSMHVGDQVEQLVRSMVKPRHLVLTVKSRPESLVQQLQDLRQWFAKLRRTPFWKKNVSAGVYTIEVTINERTALWHPHIHCVFEGQYLPFKIVQRLWHETTGGSEIIWLEPVDNAQGMARELCKYIGKPQDAAHWTDSQLQSYALAIHGQRMMQTFGKAKPKPIIDAVPKEPIPENRWSISITKVLWMASQGWGPAYKALPLIAERWPHLGRYIYQRMPQLEPELTKAERMLNIMAIIETGKAPPRGVAPPRRAAELIEAEISGHLLQLHDLEADGSWHRREAPDAE